VQQHYKRNRAVVIGAGVGGLTAATALAPHFEQVLILEKDSVHDSSATRKSVAQGSHLHSLLLGGLNILEVFYPGIGNTLKDHGAVTLRAGLHQQIHESGSWLPEQDVGFDIIAQSRPLLENVIREKALATANVLLLKNAHAKNILLDEKDRVVGINYQDDRGLNQHLNTEVLVDASGLSGYFVKQLSTRYEDMAKVDIVQSNIAYASAKLKKPEHFRDRKESILIIPEPEYSAGGALIDIEDHCWIVSLHGRNGLIPPADF